MGEGGRTVGPVSLQKQAQVHWGRRPDAEVRGMVTPQSCTQASWSSSQPSAPPGVFPAGLGNRRSERTPEMGSGLAGQDFHLQLQVMRLPFPWGIVDSEW